MLINVYVASPDPDPNPRGGGQLPNPNECNSTLTSGTNNIYPYLYTDVNDRGHRFRSGSPLTNYPHATSCNVQSVQHTHKDRLTQTWRSGYYYLNKEECNLNQPKDDSSVERVAKNNSCNNGDRHKIHEIFLLNCFVFVIILVSQTVHSSAMIQITANLMEKTLQLTVSW